MSSLVITALLLASCAPTVTEEKEAAVLPQEEEVVTEEEKVVTEEEEEAVPAEEEVVVEVETSFEAAKYVNADYGFSVKGPSDWIVEELDEEALERGIVFQASATDSVPGLAVSILDAAEGTTLAEVLPTALDYPDLEIVSTSETTLANGKSATEAVVSFTTEGYPIDGWYLGVLEGDKWIIVGVYTVAQYFPIEEELALEVLHTLQFEAADEDEVTFKEPTSTEPAYTLELLWSDATLWYPPVLTGRVKNISDESLEDVEVMFLTYDSEGHFVCMMSALISKNPLLPGESSTFEVRLTECDGDAATIKMYSVGFRFLDGDMIPSYPYY